jgi:hypothetical protein
MYFDKAISKRKENKIKRKVKRKTFLSVFCEERMFSE